MNHEMSNGVPALEYNSERDDLNLPEYGRHIQKLVDHCRDLESKEERNKMARAIIDVMGNLSPHLRDVADLQHKLWDQLFIIADFDLDVDSPYPVHTEEELFATPEKMDYPQKRPKYRFYGNNIQRMIDTARSWEKGEKREALTFIIANHMKKCFLNWNKDSVKDEVIFSHLYELSEGEINLAAKDEDLRDASALVRNKGKRRSNHKRNSGRRNKRRR